MPIHLKKTINIDMIAFLWTGDIDPVNRHVGDSFGVDWEYASNGRDLVIKKTKFGMGIGGCQIVHQGDWIVKIGDECFACPDELFKSLFGPEK